MVTIERLKGSILVILYAFIWVNLLLLLYDAITFEIITWTSNGELFDNFQHSNIFYEQWIDDKGHCWGITMKLHGAAILYLSGPLLALIFSNLMEKYQTLSNLTMVGIKFPLRFLHVLLYSVVIFLIFSFDVFLDSLTVIDTQEYPTLLKILQSRYFINTFLLICLPILGLHLFLSIVPKKRNQRKIVRVSLTMILLKFLY